MEETQTHRSTNISPTMLIHRALSGCCMHSTQDKIARTYCHQVACCLMYQLLTEWSEITEGLAMIDPMKAVKKMRLTLKTVSRSQSKRTAKFTNQIQSHSSINVKTIELVSTILLLSLTQRKSALPSYNWQLQWVRLFKVDLNNLIGKILQTRSSSVNPRSSPPRTKHKHVKGQPDNNKPLEPRTLALSKTLAPSPSSQAPEPIGRAKKVFQSTSKSIQKRASAALQTVSCSRTNLTKSNCRVSSHRY